MTQKVRAVLHDGMAADAAVQELIEAHFDENAIGVSKADGQRHHERKLLYRNADKVGILVGGAAGAAAGLAVAALVVSGVLSVEWLAAFLDRGWLSGPFRGAVVGGCFGALWGGIASMGWWSQKAPVADDERGAFVVSVTTEDERAESARGVLARRGRVLPSVSPAAAPTPAPPASPAPRSG